MQKNTNAERTQIKCRLNSAKPYRYWTLFIDRKRIIGPGPRVASCYVKLETLWLSWYCYTWPNWWRQLLYTSRMLTTSSLILPSVHWIWNPLLADTFGENSSIKFLRVPSNLFWLANVCTGRRHRTSPTSSSGPRTSRLGGSLSVSIKFTDCPSYTAVDCRRPSFPGRCCSCLKQRTTSRHVRAVFVSFLQSFEDSSFSPVPEFRSDCEV